MYVKRFILLLHIIFIDVTTSFFLGKGDDDTEFKIHRKAASKDDENFFDIEQKDTNGKTIEFDRFVGLNTIVAFKIFKEGQSCKDIDKIFKEFLQLYFQSPVSVAFVIVPDSMEVYDTCSNVVHKNFVSKRVIHAVMKPKTTGQKHLVFKYFTNLYDPKKIEDETYYIVKADGDVELHYEVPSPIELMKPFKFLIKHMYKNSNEPNDEDRDEI